MHISKLARPGESHMEATRKGAVLIGGSPEGLIGSDSCFGYVYQYNLVNGAPSVGG